MDNAEKIACTLAGIILMAVALSTFYDIGHNKGYIYGANQAQEYHNATGTFPTES